MAEDETVGSDVVSQIARRAAADPAAPAIRAPDGTTISRADLRAASAGIADCLLTLGVGPGTVVAIHGRRGETALKAILGVLEAGAAWLPLDADLPPARIAKLLSAAGCRYLVSCEPSLPEAIGDGDVRAPQPELGGGRVAVLPNEAGASIPRNAAYVMFTSGTTGDPKGVVVSRPALAHFVEAAARRYPVRSEDRVLQFASLAFDISVEEIFLSLATGATLVLRPPGPMSPAAFLASCAREEISVTSLPTAFWHQLAAWIDADDAEVPTSLRTVIIGGEAAAAQAVATWRRRAPTTRLLNTYGPTETTIAVTAIDLNDAADGDEGAPPIGTPLDGVRVELRNPAESPRLEPGQRARLQIGGPTVGSGYLVNGSFDPLAGGFYERNGERWYDSGDIAWRDHAGHLHFVGRLDDQVKVRGGFRVTLGEVEHVLTSLPGVVDGIVLAPTDPDGTRTLVAVSVLEAGISAAATADRLRAELPAPAVPLLLTIDALPHTHQGKVDRGALIAWAENQRADDDGVEGPLEAAIAEWSRVLGRADVTGETHLFRAGGDSIGATRIATAMARRGHPVKIADVFETPTPMGLVERIANRGRPAADDRRG